MSKDDPTPDSFRDHIATVNRDGSRKWIYPKKPAGRFYRWRTIVSLVFLIILVTLPFIKVGGDPLFLFNVTNGRFILFGVVFTPQDMHLFALAMITMMVFIVLFTVVFGRVFCGWVCPQTIFMEMVFRKIEFWIEGDANQQKKLNKAPWTTKKIAKKTTKHFIFALIAIIIGNIFLTYIVGVDEVTRLIVEPISDHIGGFLAMVIFSGLFYGVFAFFREQVCVAVCPYGRLQGVLLVKNSIVVIYDWVRGEPRGKIKKNRKTKDSFQALPIADKLGDCIDCKLCVQVCPTGIDIRHGTQMECVNCTACIDACDEVMEKIDRPKGLIRYDAYDKIEKGEGTILTPRVKAYAGVLIALLVFQGFLFQSRSDVEALLLRTPGMLFQEADDGRISNLYNYQLTNKTTGILSDIRFELVSPLGDVEVVGNIPNIDKASEVKGSLFIRIDPDDLDGRKTKLKINVYSGGVLLDEIRTNFLGPIK